MYAQHSIDFNIKKKLYIKNNQILNEKKTAEDLDKDNQKLHQKIVGIFFVLC